MSNRRRKSAAPAQGTFHALFLARIADIEARAYAHGTNFTQLCMAAKIGRAAPVRWRRRPPKTIRIIDKLEAQLRKIEAAAAKTV